jgi:hypothetical protein
MTTPERQLADLFVADGREPNRGWWAAFFAGLPDVSVTMEDLVVSGDRVVGRFTYRGTHSCPAAAGRP